MQTQSLTHVRAIRRIITLGRRQGFVTYNQIQELYPQADEDAETLASLVRELLEAGIAVGEEARASEAEPNDDLLASAAEEAEEEDEEGPSLPAAPSDLSAELPSDDPFALYLREVSCYPLLTAQEEVILARRMERGRRASQRSAVGNLPRRDLARLNRIIQDGNAARDHLIKANSRLVISVARRYVGRGVPFLDLIQEGNIGLMRAVKKFDYKRGYKFSTYATWWIRQAVSRAVADQGRTIRVPVHMHDQIRRYAETRRRLAQELGRDSTTEEVAEAMQIPVQKVERIQMAAQVPISLETPIGDDDDSFLGDLIEDHTAEPPVDAATREILRECVNEVLTSFSPREVRILRLRFGLEDGRPHTLEEVGRKFGLTRERIRQIEAEALQRLRHPRHRRRLQDYLR
ncbi:MAG: sigma-70 family RNA polymerase sigma factor [Chloroflexi bacterium]|nr:sigma-70 family RNA polymerase sigma factor [Chloroflexota bacterium]